MTLFVNMHVKDLPASVTFFRELGFSLDEKFTSDETGVVILGEGASLLLVAEPLFKTITGRDIPDVTAGNEAVLAVEVDSRAKVDEVVTAALANGGTDAGQPEDNEYMYSRGFRDLDGHFWNILHMA
ncbi:VOC family protein [Nonomuraea typhae]|uniref:VOC family protein n=1 Tax=Nonomuraea typhae TaxID=2603600 RepID=UPI0012F99E6B|nr:VOC family protein [Nonomuraea typhae]